jgi:hypothetical protein
MEEGYLRSRADLGWAIGDIGRLKSAGASSRSSLVGAIKTAPSHRRSPVALSALLASAAVLAIVAAPALARETHLFAPPPIGAPGSAAGQLALPASPPPSAGLAVDAASGDVYVADVGNHRIDQFTAAGAFVRAWGWGVSDGSAEAQVCTTSCQEGLAGPEPGEFEAPAYVAVDNSPGASHGDVYVGDAATHVVQKFTAEGALVASWAEGGQLFETPVLATGTGTTTSGGAVITELTTSSGEFRRGQTLSGAGIPAGTTVESAEAGELTLSAEATASATNVPLSARERFASLLGIAVDPSGNLWVYDEEAEMREFAPDGSAITEFNTGIGPNARGIAVDSADDIYLVRGAGAVAKIDSSGAELIGEVDSREATGLAVDPATDHLYIDFGSEVGEFSPAGGRLDSFGSKEAAGGGLKAAQGVAVGPGHLVYVANGSVSQLDAFEAAQVPEVTTLPPSIPGAGEAILRGEVNPGGVALTECVFEYGLTLAYESSAPCASPDAAEVGAAGSTVAVQARIGGLPPNRFVHFRLRAANAEHGATGAELGFSTENPTAVGGGLPDGRAYELVSPNLLDSSNSAFVEPIDEHNHRDLFTKNPFRAAADGEALAYTAGAPPTGGAGSTGIGAGDQYLARRDASSGWSGTDIMPLQNQPQVYEGFTGDLSFGILSAGKRGSGAAFPPLTPDAPPGCQVTYRYTGGSEPFHTAFTETQTPGECGQPLYAGTSADASQVLFETEAGLAPGDEAAGPRGSGEYNLYDSVGGRIFRVNLLPDGEPAPNATFGVSSRFPGGEAVELYGSDFERVVSSSGARIVWTDLDTEPGPENPAGTTRLFVRENASGPDAGTVQVDAAVGGGGQYRGASNDDAEIYFTKGGRLYRFTVESEATQDLTPEGGVVGVAGISESGDEVYLVARTVLAENENEFGEEALPGSCEKAEQFAEEEQPARGCNLYLLQASGPTRFIARLIPHDGNTEVPGGEASQGGGDWIGNLGLRTAEVSPSGSLAFTTTRSLTGYQNNGVQEIYLSNPSTGQLLCVSCDPTGKPADPGTVFALNAQGANLPPVPAFNRQSASYQYRWVSANGNRVFFNSTEELVPEDSDGTGINDVYEWERDGEGSCSRSPGCVYLLSGSEGSSEAEFVDASENGDDVFFTTRADLVPENSGDNVVVYDARVGGGFTSPAVGCSATNCAGAPGVAPAFASPASESTSGPGNVPKHHKKKHKKKKHKHHQKTKSHHHSGKRTAGNDRGGKK